MAPNPSDNSPGGKPADDDWLGYGAYADALWSRVVRALEKDKGGKPLGDDPLVVGIFGEWGAGKSHLLKLLNKRAEFEMKAQISAREIDAGFSLTVPVMFQPWKYEHEEHLHVPMVIHVLNALKDALKRDPTVVQSLVESGKKAFSFFEQAKPALTKGAKVAKAVFPVVQKTLASISVLGTRIELPDEMEDWLEAAADAGSEAAKDKAQAAKKKKLAEHAAKPSLDGSYFYRIHELLGALTRPGQYEERKSLFDQAELTPNTRINFVIFIDDLDRCMPEKAVQALELIKTIFNTESFAFVLALDDEVIERGIGHRYKDYFLQGKKPDMPITGFEYLEKIVHVPFRLPALTPDQARAFVRSYEKQVETDPARRWFDEQVDLASAPLRQEVADISPALATSKSKEQAIAPTDLLDLALSGFDAFMPRKLIRLVELLHQVAEIARLRERPLRITSSDGIDVRVVLVNLLIQLFQPEMFRLIRRRGDCFPTLLAAFAPRPVLAATVQAPDLPADLKSAAIADIDLWRWAVDPKMGESEDWKPEALESTHSYVVNRIANAFKGKPSDRTSAQQVRLPLVLQLIEHRSAQRHVFDVLKLTKRLADEMVRTRDKPHELVFEPYRSLLAKVEPVPGTMSLNVIVPMATFEMSGTSGQADGSAESMQVRQATAPTTFSISNVDELAALLLSPETEAQANMASRHEMPIGRIMDQRTMRNLVAALTMKLGESGPDSRPVKELRLLNGLQYLAPFVGEHGRLLWDLVRHFISPEREAVPKVRALWGDVRSLLGCDDRFNPERPYLFKTRFNGNLEKDEPIPGFVSIPAGDFQMGSEDVSNNPPRTVTIREPFYICRTLVTVQQYSKFIDTGGYADNNAWWDKQGVDWRNGGFDSKVKDKDYKEWLARRGVDLRKMPMDWAEQRRLASRPVVGVSWFEARAYARWLSEQMRGPLDAAKLEGYQVLLPTEDQWERAARAASTAGADARKWPWGDDEKLADQQANLNQTVGSVCAVGLYRPTPIGLYDMAGNAWEWMDNLYKGAAVNSARVSRDQDLVSEDTHENSDTPALRCGSWFGDPVNARCSFRNGSHPDDWLNGIGFRVVLSLAN